MNIPRIEYFEYDAEPCENASAEIKNFLKEYGSKNVLEVGAGDGRFAALLNNHSYFYVATDLHPILPPFRSYYRVIEMCSGAAVTRFDPDTLIIIWPPYNNMAFDALSIFKGDKLIYIGEHWFADFKNPLEECTMGTLNFFEILRERFDLIKTVDMPNRPNHCAKTYIYLRKC